MNITIRNLGFSTQNHNAGIARKPVQSKPDVFIKNQDRLSFSGFLVRDREKTVRRFIKTADDLLHNIRLDVMENGGRYTISGRLTEESVERSLRRVKELLSDESVKHDVTKILRKNNRPDGAATSTADMLNYHTRAGINL